MENISPRMMLCLWQAVERCSNQLGRIHYWAQDGTQTHFWPRAEMHPVPTLVLCLQGTVRCLRAPSAQRAAVDLQQGELLLIAAGVCHQHVAIRPGHAVLQLGFLPHTCDYWFLLGERRWHARLPSQPYRLYMDAACQQPDQAHGELSNLLCTLMDEERHEPYRLSPALERMQRYLQQNAHLPIRAEDIVAASGLQHSQAYELFVAHYGAPPFQILQQRRCELALARLQSGLDVATCAASSGFRHLRALRHAFRRYKPEYMAALDS